MKFIIFLLILTPTVSANIDFTLNYDHLTINKSCIIANTEMSIEIPIYTGRNWVSTPLYPNYPTLDGVFGDIAGNNDIVRRYVNSETKSHSAEYFTGYGWYEYMPVEPIEPEVGYEYNRVGADCTLIINGTYLPKDETCNIYNYFNFKNMIGTNIIRPKRCIYDE